MGQSGGRAAYKAAVWRYLQSELGRTATPIISARLMDLPEAVTGPGPYTESDLHDLRLRLDHYARTYRVSTRVFVAYSLPR